MSVAGPAAPACSCVSLRFLQPRDDVGKALPPLLLGAGVQPVLMTLPPIDAERYLDFICRSGRSRENIVYWLGDVQRIYHYQEMYSAAITRCAWQHHLPLIDVRSAFLPERDLPDMIAADGIHLTMAGYERLFELLSAGGQSI